VRHLRTHFTQKKFQESEKLLSKIPSELKWQIAQKTHQSVFTEIKFFKNKSTEFTNIMVHELKPINLFTNDLLYTQGDQPTDIFFINTGKIKIVSDLNEFIVDEELELVVKEYERIVNSVNTNLIEEQPAMEFNYDKSGLISIVAFVAGTMFGDGDVFAQ
jgi:CRP-like cAMP-binding protein